MIFISYRRNTGIGIGQLLASSLRHEKYQVFFDIESMRNGKWQDQLWQNLHASEDYILIVADNKDIEFDESNLDEDFYYQEIKRALDQQKNIIIVAPKGIDFKRKLPKDIASIFDYEVVTYDPVFFESILHKICSFLKSDQPGERVENKYDTVRFEAQKRLSDQHVLFREANDSVYDKILSGKKNFNILDIGCNDGCFAEMHFLNREGCSRVVGVEVSEKIFKHMITNDRFYPYLLDCEADDFIGRLREIMTSLGIEHFDLINLSFLLLHLKKPHTLLYRIRELLAPDGYIFIRDIDDAQTYAFPDDEEYIKRLKEINNYCLHTGNRNTGGGIYTSLIDAGYSNVSLISELFSTAQATKSERKRLFYVNYSYIAENVMDMVNLNPTVKRYQDDYRWVQSNIENIEHLFSQKRFFYRMGAVAFIAQYIDD